MNDKKLNLMSGYVGILLFFLFFVGGITCFIAGAARNSEFKYLIFVGILLLAFALLTLFGFVVNPPNTSRVVTLFGNYVGTVNETGFYWGNPFYWRKLVSLRMRTFETGVEKSPEIKDPSGKVLQSSKSSRSPLKVNDKDGTPIEISAVVVWKVIRPTDAVFQIDDYEEFVRVQADAALRNLASRYSYDAPEDSDHSLRGHIDEVASKLRDELQKTFDRAGVEVIESRISYLAYAPEIASSMLQRQQAGAMIAARKQIVDAAVGMVEHALEELNKRKVVELDPERRAAMVSNLMVVLCSHSQATPVVNTGTLYN